MYGFTKKKHTIKLKRTQNKNEDDDEFFRGNGLG
jgi:hypothetical protein